MGASVLNVRELDIDALIDLWGVSDENGDHETCRQAQAEIERRCKGPAPVTHNVPKWLSWLPGAMWHTKPGGGGE